MLAWGSSRGARFSSGEVKICEFPSDGMMFGFDWDRLPNRDLFEYLVHRTCLSNLQANSASSLKSETLMWTDLLSILVWT